MTNILFSILIANYNNGRYLKEAVQSVFDQTYTNWEIIIVDDGSTDCSKEIYRELQSDSRIHIYFNEENKGCGYTKRRCVELANGELCGFLDPDDALHNDAIKIILDHYDVNSNTSMISPRYMFCNEKLEPLWSAPVYDEDNKDYLTERVKKVQPFTVFPISKYKLTSGIDESLKRAVDVDLYYKLDEVGSWKLINDIVYKYRLHDSSLSIGHYKALYWHVKVLEKTAERRSMSAEDLCDILFSQQFGANEQELEKTQQCWCCKLKSNMIRISKKIIGYVKAHCKRLCSGRPCL